MNYIINEPIRVYYRAVGAESGITDLQFITTNPSGVDQSTILMTAVSGHSGLYTGTFTPNAYGLWWIRLKSTTYSENVYAESYFIGENKLNGVHESEGWNSTVTKINYTVPTGKVFFITAWHISALSDASGHTFSLRIGSSQIGWISTNNDASTTILRSYPNNNPYGPISAGNVITIALISGSTNEQWGAELDGYLENA